MIGNCVSCLNIFTGKDIKLVQEDKFNTRQYDVNCSVCGANYKVWIRQMNGPTILDKELQERMNTPRKEKKNVNPGPPTEPALR